jgi:hypothetical protein
MARNHFAIEQPRKISIAIEGYDPRAQSRAQTKKLTEKRRRAERRQKRNATGADTHPNASQTPDSEPEVLAIAAAESFPIGEVDLFNQQLSEAFDPGDGHSAAQGSRHADA